MFPHEKLRVYSKALTFVAAVSGFSATWNRKHAVVDQLDRASESLILNLADSARLRSGPSKQRALDYTIGSGLECAACLDIARLKHLLTESEADQEKQRLCEVVRMLVGLRKAWETWETREDSVPYDAEVPANPPKPLFHHETLEVFTAALDLMTWLVSLPGSRELSERLPRQIDESVTSIILNIAEGNGRYSELDHRRFLEIAAGSAVKTAAYLDLAVHKVALSPEQVAPAKSLLVRIVAMLSRM
jgi:four helix bundle protein